MITGFATVDGTKKYLNQFCHADSLTRHTPWFSTSAIAIGTHLGEMTKATSALYRSAITYAVKNGINFIDTALNYRGMRSERDIGSVLNSMINLDKALERESVIIATKAGIIPGDIDAGLPPPQYLNEVLIGNEIIQEKDLHIVGKYKHVMVPDYYQFAIERSKEHLGIETIDIHYIHNPEISMEVCGPDIFYRKLCDLVEFYEEQVNKGNIRFYGMATWQAFYVESSASSHISLSKVIQVAESVAGSNHHFRFVQMPYNINLTDASTKKTQLVGNRLMSALQAAEELGLFVNISSPLNQGQALKTIASPKDLLHHVIRTKGVFAAMVGMKNKHHVEENIGIISNVR